MKRDIKMIFMSYYLHAKYIMKRSQLFFACSLVLVTYSEGFNNKNKEK